MKFYAVGLTRAGTEESRIGPFDTKEDAKAEGERKSAEASGDFVFEAVVDEAGNQVFPEGSVKALNSSNNPACNAKFSQGDWVEVVEGKDKGRKGFVTKSWTEGVADNPNGVQLYALEFRDAKGRGSTYGVAERALKKTAANASRTSCAVVANAISANRRVGVAKNAKANKYKVDFENVTFDGVSAKSKTMTEEQLKEFLGKLHLERIFTQIEVELERGKAYHDNLSVAPIITVTRA